MKKVEELSHLAKQEEVLKEVCEALDTVGASDSDVLFVSSYMLVTVAQDCDMPKDKFFELLQGAWDNHADSAKNEELH